MIEIVQHNIEIALNRGSWAKKKLLHLVYGSLYGRMAAFLRHDLTGPTVELGSGIGAVKAIIPDCITTDIFPNPWVDRKEDAYQLSCEADSVSNIILLDVFHHLQFPGTAFEEFNRVLIPGGRIVICDPCQSALGLLVYGVLHHEPLGLTNKIRWNAPPDWTPDQAGYYAAQGNCWRIFGGNNYVEELRKWNVISVTRHSDLSYVASGGFSKPQLYPTSIYGFMRILDRIADFLPSVFATRVLVVLEKRLGYNNQGPRKA